MIVACYHFLPWSQQSTISMSYIEISIILASCHMWYITLIQIQESKVQENELTIAYTSLAYQALQIDIFT